MSIGFFYYYYFFNTLRPPSKLVDCIVFLQRWGSWNDNSVWLQLDGTIRGGRKRGCFAIRPGLQNALMQLWSLLHILFPSSRWMYQEAALSLPPGWEMNRCGRRAPHREEELISPQKEVPSISSWFTRRCTRVALRRAFSQTDRPLTSPLIFLTHAQECKSSAHGCSSRTGESPVSPWCFFYFFCFTNVHFTLSYSPDAWCSFDKLQRSLGWGDSLAGSNWSSTLHARVFANLGLRKTRLNICKLSSWNCARFASQNTD